MYRLIGVVVQFWTLKLFYQLHIAFMEIVKKVAQGNSGQTNIILQFELELWIRKICRDKYWHTSLKYKLVKKKFPWERISGDFKNELEIGLARCTKTTKKYVFYSLQFINIFMV